MIPEGAGKPVSQLPIEQPTVWRSKLFWKIYGITSLLTVVASATACVFLLSLLEARAVQWITGIMQDQALIFRHVLAQAHGATAYDPRFQRWIQEIDQMVAVRMTVIRNDGEVLYDSAKEPAALENHLDRPEIRAAEASGAGTIIRHSDTLGRRLLYFAIPYEAQGQKVGYIRTAISLDVLDSFQATARRLIVASLAALLIAILGPMMLVARSLTRRISIIKSAATAVGQGSFQRLVPGRSNDEIDGAYGAFNFMADQIERRDRELRESELRYRRIVEVQSELITNWLPDGRLTFVNPAYCKCVGKSSDELIGSNWIDALHPSLRENARMRGSALSATNRAATGEFAVRRSDGREEWFEWTDRALIDADDRLIGIQTVARDVTRSRLAEQSLRQSEKRYRTVSETATDAIVTIDAQSTILFANRATEKIFGHPFAELVGQPLTMLMPEDLQAAHRAGLSRYSETRRRRIPWEGVEITGQHASGRLIALEISFGEDIQEDGNRFFTGIIRDITARKEADRHREETEVRLQRITDAVPGMVVQYEVDPAGAERVAFCSRGSIDLIGRTPDEIGADASLPWQHVVPEDLPVLRQTVAKSIRDCTPWSRVFRVRHLDGRLRWIQGNSHPVRRSDGVTVSYGVFHDVTDREIDKESMRMIVEGTAGAVGREFFQSLVEHLAKALNVRYAMLGELTLPDVRRIRTTAVWGNDRLAPNFDYDLAGTPCERVAADGLCFHTTGVRERFPNDTLLAEMGVDAYMGVPLRDSKGGTIGLLAVLHDHAWDKAVDAQSILQIFAARASAEIERIRDEDVIRALNSDLESHVRERTAALLQTEAKYRRLVEGLQRDYIFFTLAPDGTLTYASPSFEQVLGRPCDEALFRNLRKLLSSPDGDQLAGLLSDGFSSGQDHAFADLEFLCRDGSARLMEVCLVPVRADHGTLIAVDAIAKDMTQHRLIEEALRRAKDAAESATRQKSQFLANMSHELRTPLNGVIGVVDLLDCTELTSKQRRYVEIARSSGELLLSIINDVLDFSKIEAGKLELDAVDFDLHQLLGGVVEMFRHRAESKGLELRSWLGDDCRLKLAGDPARLRQVLVNLVSNAIKFTAAGSVALEAQLLALAGGAANLSIRVRDTGIGIDPADSDRLFGSFEQADASTTRRFGGAGLGLAICKQVVEAMGGSIRVESELGKGSCFCLGLKLPLAADRSVLIADASDAAGLAGIRVLAVDDNPADRALLQEQLSERRIDCSVAHDASTAFRMLQQAQKEGAPFDAIVLDVEMPETDGISLARWIRAGAEFGSLVVVLLSSTSVNATILEELGVSAQISKPIWIDELTDALLAALPDRLLPRARRIEDAIGAAGRRVLVVEDNEINAEIVAELLTERGFAVEVIEDGTKAVERATGADFDVVLMDCHLPVMDGITATKKIRHAEIHGMAARSASNPIPIIAMTAGATTEERALCLAAGMSDFATKPIDIDELVEKIQACLS